MKKHYYGLFALLTLAGCATSIVHPDQADPVPADRLYAFTQKTGSDDAKITVVRDEGLYGSACGLIVRIDGKRAAMLSTGEVASFHVTPGEHSLSAGLSGQGMCSHLVDKSIELVAKPSQQRTYRLSFDQGGFYINPYIAD